MLVYRHHIYITYSNNLTIGTKILRTAGENNITTITEDDKNNKSQNALIMRLDLLIASNIPERRAKAHRMHFYITLKYLFGLDTRTQALV